MPYIGITDFTIPEQVRRICNVPTTRVLDPKMGHVLGVGVMMSYKTLRGLPTKWSAAFPPKESIAQIFIDDPDVFNILHYADYDGVTTVEDYREALLYGGPNIDAIQLDMVWPDIPRLVQAFHRDTGTSTDLKIILQVGALAMEAQGDDPEKVADLLCRYHETNCLDYVLLDKSMGRGRGMDAELLIRYYRAIRKRLSSRRVGVVVAGGLGPSTVGLLDPFRREGIYLDISIDAQGKLRSSGNALDPIDWNMAEEYFAQATMFFGWL